MGCGPATVETSGKVTYEGKPVKGGSLVFAPIENEGKPATCPVGDDGTFSMEGITAGKNKVSYSAPAVEAAEGEGAHSEAKPSEYAKLVPESPEINIAGDAEVEVKLVAKK